VAAPEFFNSQRFECTPLQVTGTAEAQGEIVGNVDGNFHARHSSRSIRWRNSAPEAAGACRAAEEGEGLSRCFCDEARFHHRGWIPVAKDNGYFLIALPRETMGGFWRVWLAKDVFHGEALKGAA
jgi:hypothetical protein